MAICSKIASDILYNCNNLVAGIKDMAIFINFDDVDKDSCTFDPANPMLLTQLVLKTASPELTAFQVEGHNYSNKHSAELIKGTYQNSWEHNFKFGIFDNTPEVKLWIDNAVDSRFMIIQENNYSSNASPAGRTVYEVLGYDNGLEVKVAARDPDDEEMKGGWNIEAGCHEKVKESKPPLALYVGGSITATRAAVTALL